MSDDSEATSSFKRDITNAFDAINSYLIKKKAKFKETQLEFIPDIIHRRDQWGIPL